MSNLDVIVVGAGPAGAATAALLAESGVRVAMLDRARFPRHKPCAEYLSPEATRILDRLGLTSAIESHAPARLKGMRIVAPNGTPFSGRFAGAHDYRGYSDHGLALRRWQLDQLLVQAAVDRGATLIENTSLEEIGEPERGVRRLRVRCGSRRTALSASLVVGADGLNSRIAHQLRLSRRGRRRRVALVSHAVGVRGMQDVGEMHVGYTGYLGLAPIGKGVTNVAVVVDTARARVPTPTVEALRVLITQYSRVMDRFRKAEFISPVMAVGPFARTTRRATTDHALLVGDAADFYDPFTGEGIYAALRGAEMCSRHIRDALTSGQPSAQMLRGYDDDRRTAFSGKWAVERMISWALSQPRVFDHIAERLAVRGGLADLLVGVAGDFVPPAAVLRPSFLLKLAR